MVEGECNKVERGSRPTCFGSVERELGLLAPPYLLVTTSLTYSPRREWRLIYRGGHYLLFLGTLF